MCRQDLRRRNFSAKRGNSGPFIGPYENKPRGRIFYLPEQDRYEVAVGRWIDEYPQAKALILEEFDLPADKTTFQYAIHWDIGHTWR